MLGGPDKRNQGFFIIGNTEMLHRKIPGSFIIRIPLTGKIIGPDGHPANGEIGADARGKHFFQDIFPVSCRQE